MRFVILVPKSLDPSARGRKMPVPDARPSEKIAKLFPQTDPLKDQKNGANNTAAAKSAAASPVSPAAGAAQTPAAASTTQAAVTKPVPLPEARPTIKPVSEQPRRRAIRRYRYRR
jgi:membrane-bound lytic murein transglycosylase A